MCLACNVPLGYVPELAAVRALEPARDEGCWRVLGSGERRAYRRCVNFDSPAGCNWLVPVRDASAHCRSCRLNRTIPDLSNADNRRYWGAIENAKRRLISELIVIGLPVKSKIGEDPERGVAFDLLRAPSDGPPVVTGHGNGIITLDVEEADDAKREQTRHDLHEPYRTLLGHFRHEIGHYYWDRLVAGSRWQQPFRTLFGDERADYAVALNANYEQGPPADWRDRFISPYASAHPWEDWAETWAHFLHIYGSLDTATAFGVTGERVVTEIEPFSAADLYAPEDPDADRFLFMMNAWVGLTTVLNELARSMGQPDFYPFVMSRPVLGKLQFIYLVIKDARAAELERAFSPETSPNASAST